MWAWLLARLPVMMLLLCAQIMDCGADIKPLPDTELGLDSWLLPPLWQRCLLLKESRIVSPREVNSGWSQIFRCCCQTFYFKGPRHFLFACFFINMCFLSGCCANCATHLHYEPLHIHFFHLLSTTIGPDQPGSWKASTSPLQLPFNVWCTVLALGFDLPAWSLSVNHYRLI